MKNLLLTLLLLALATNLLLAQQKQRSHLEINSGIFRSFHQESLVPRINRGEVIARTIQDQQPLWSSGLEVSYVMQLGNRHMLKSGLGFTRYQYQETGTVIPVDGNAIDYTETVKARFLTYNLGYRFLISPATRIKPYVEGNLVYEIYYENENVFDLYVQRDGIGLQPAVGCLVQLAPWMHFNLNAFYRTALNSYTKEPDLSFEYTPYAYGINLGLNLRL